jgi:hypothetical protein
MAYGYPQGTRSDVSIDAQTDEPQTKARGREFQETFAAAAEEARQLIADTLRQAGYDKLTVTITEKGWEDPWG